MKFVYYPGCSLESTAKEYDLSARAIARVMEVEMLELADWNCCGATSAHSTNRLLGLVLPARNLALAQDSGRDLLVPCSACYSRLKTADYYLRYDEKVRNDMENMLGFNYQGNIKVFSLLEVFTVQEQLEKITRHVTHPLKGLRVACYYGCLLVHPPEVTHFDDPENPSRMDKLMALLGAEPVPWSYKTECCGASQGLVNGKMVRRIVSRLIRKAQEAGARAVVTACPLCQANLEMRREKGGENMPVFYFTELIGFSFGLPDSLKWFKKHLWNPGRLLASLGLVV
ncbi:MAG: CoB--CoM heterodisulfide reductase iron-sulfur subunit B family protein [Firmicutes bacterium]|nr:CoB--CoM heterodisulfide reductase iron-sulfur subunit B family protein [Bacillota bacterium]